MKRIGAYFILSCLIAYAISFPVHHAKAESYSDPQSAPRKRALLVGISNYCRGSADDCRAGGKYWWNLNSEPDVDAIKAILIEKFGFKESEIKVLKTPQETTRQSIIDAFKSFLIAPSQKGDIIYFHYSGHGSQVPDDNTTGQNPAIGDELDGLDECLVPSDYVSQADGSKSIRDDEIADLLAQLKAKQPANVTLSFDSCFSGTVTRGGQRLVRGAQWSGRHPAVRGSARGKEEGPSGLFHSNDAASQDYVVISATRNDQVAQETRDENERPMGMLSYALVKAFKDAGPHTTYRDIFEQITDEVTGAVWNQNPQLEGKRDNLLFSGIASPPQPYVRVDVDGEGRVILRAGRLQGMTPGSRFAIHRTGTQDPKKTAPIAEGEITEVNVTTSVLKLSQPLHKDKLEALKTARAFETSHKFGDLRLEVDARGLAGNPRGGEIINDLKSSDLISAEPGDGASWDVRICRGDCPDTKPLVQGEYATGSAANSFTLQRDDGSVIKRIADGPDVAGEIRRALEGEARWRFIKALENTGNPRIKIKFRLVPVTDVKIGASGLASSAVRKSEEVTPTRGGQIVLHEDDYVMIEVMNEGDIPAYVTILDLRVDGTIGPLWPHPLVPVGKSEENQIPPDKRWHLIPAPFVIQISEPFGPEVFKAIATSEPADFSPLVDFSTISRGSPRGNARGAKESLSPIGQLLMTATLGRSRGAGLAGKLTATALDPSDWSTSVITFEARPKGAKN